MIESRVVEKCAPSSGMVSYALGWFCSLLPRREKVVHGARTEGTAGHQPLLMDLLQHRSDKTQDPARRREDPHYIAPPRQLPVRPLHQVCRVII